MALAYSGSVTKKDIADRLGVTPSAFGQRLKTGKFTQAELETIASVLEAEYVSYFKFRDGKRNLKQSLRNSDCFFYTIKM